MRYIDKLIENCLRAKSIKPTQEFVYNDLSELDNIKQAIYIIEDINGNIIDTFIKFKEYKFKEGKKKEGGRKCSKLNIPSKIMYVGSSTTSIKKRIKEHIGEGYKRTYALHLKHWFNGKYKITIKLYDTDREILQIIEDDLSHELKPAFGKKGSNNM